MPQISGCPDQGPETRRKPLAILPGASGKQAAAAGSATRQQPAAAACSSSACRSWTHAACPHDSQQMVAPTTSPLGPTATCRRGGVLGSALGRRCARGRSRRCSRWPAAWHAGANPQPACTHRRFVAGGPGLERAPGEHLRSSEQGQAQGGCQPGSPRKGCAPARRWALPGPACTPHTHVQTDLAAPRVSTAFPSSPIMTRLLCRAIVPCCSRASSCAACCGQRRHTHTLR